MTQTSRQPKSEVNSELNSDNPTEPAPITHPHDPQIAGPEDCTNAQYPDPQFTPGMASTSANVKDLCTPGYTSTIRNVTEAEAHQVFKNYNIESKFNSPERGDYEVDHFISLELGGTNDITNLWPEKYEPKPGARQKDVVETNLHHRVCDGQLTIAEAQDIIKKDWCAEYLKIISKLLY